MIERIFAPLVLSSALAMFFLTDMDYTDRSHAADVIRDAGYYPFNVDAGQLNDE